MAEIDDELMARVLQWCAEAGRPASPPEVREALAPLTWDELLAVRALLADAPPARPLGPAALVDLARGTPPETAAERERERPDAAPGAVPAEEAPTAGAATPAATPPERKKTRGKASRRVATVVIRRARDRHDAPAPGEPQLPLLDELFLPEGRAILQRWVRRHGVHRARLVEELAAWRRPDGSAPDAEDAARLLDAHGMTRPFERREREELLHALRACAGTLSGAARALAISTDDLRAAVERLGIEADVERVRDDRREDIRRRATLGDRVRLLVDDADRLEDLGMTAEVEADVRSRLGEHMKALRAGSTHHVAPSFARTLGITRDQASAIAARFGLDLRDSAEPRAATAERDAAPARPPYPAQHGGGARHDTTARGDPRSRGPGRAPRAGGPRGGDAPRPTRGGTPPSRGGSRPMGGGARPMGGGGRPMSGGARGAGSRPSSGGPRRVGGSRPMSDGAQGAGSRPAGGGPRPVGGGRPMSGGAQGAGPRPASAGPRIGGGARPMSGARPPGGRARPFGASARPMGGGSRPMMGGQRPAEGAPQRGEAGQGARAGAGSAAARPATRGPRVGGRPLSRGAPRGGAKPRGESPRPRKPPRR